MTTILKVHLRVDEGSGNGEQYTDCSEVRGVFFFFFLNNDIKNILNEKNIADSVEAVIAAYLLMLLFFSNVLNQVV